MVTELRVNRYKSVHEKVNIDIQRNSVDSFESERINEIIDRLKKIDYNFFSKKLIKFSDENMFVRPYLDSDKSVTTISDDDILEMRRFLIELRDVAQYEYPAESMLTTVEEERKIYNPENEVYKNELDGIIISLNEIIKTYNSIEVKHNDIYNSLDFAKVHSIRNRDQRTFQDAKENVRQIWIELDTKRVKFRSTIEKTKKYKMLSIFLPIFLMIFILCGIAAILVAAL